MKTMFQISSSGRRLLPGFPEGPPKCGRRIVEDFGARAARTSVTHLPEVSDAYGAPLLSPMRIIRSRGTLLLFPRFRRLRRRFHRR